MVAIPFLYFSILLFLVYRKRRVFDISSFILAIYDISAFLSIFVDYFDLRYKDEQYYSISIAACVLYCSLLTLCALPFILYSNTKIKNVRPLRSTFWLKSIAVLSFLFFIFFFVMSIPSLVFVMTSDMAELRGDVYNGMSTIGWMENFSPLYRFPITFFNMLFGCPWILQFLAFFNLAIQKAPNRYTYMLLVGSLLGPLNGVLGVDRSKTAYWIISLLANYIFYKQFLSESQKRLTRKIGYVLITILTLYLGAMTSSRFSERSTGKIGGTEASLISYLGQSYINFSYFIDEYENDTPTLEMIFPLTYKLTGTGFGSSTELQGYLSERSGKQIGVFYTFLGHIFITAGGIGLFVFCLLFLALSFLKIKPKKRDVCIGYIFTYMLFASVLFLGLFAYYYTSYIITFSVILFLLMIYTRKSFKRIPYEKV